jgi:hypothetical protein
MFGNLFGGPASKLIGGALVVLLLGGGLLWAVNGIKGCVRAQDKAAVLEKATEKTQEVQDEKAEIQRETEQLSDQGLADSFHSDGGGVRRK